MHLTFGRICMSKWERESECGSLLSWAKNVKIPCVPFRFVSRTVFSFLFLDHGRSPCHWQFIGDWNFLFIAMCSLYHYYYYRSVDLTLFTGKIKRSQDDHNELLHVFLTHFVNVTHTHKPITNKQKIKSEKKKHLVASKLFIVKSKRKRTHFNVTPNYGFMLF